RCQQESRPPSVPSKADLVEGDSAEPFAAARALCAAHRAVEAAAERIVGERPDESAPVPGLGQPAAGGLEQLAADPDPLAFGPEVELIDFAARSGRDAAKGAAASHGRVT